MVQSLRASIETWGPPSLRQTFQVCPYNGIAGMFESCNKLSTFPCNHRRIYPPKNLYITYRYQKWPYFKGTTFSKPSCGVSMLVFGGVNVSNAFLKSLSTPTSQKAVHNESPLAHTDPRVTHWKTTRGAPSSNKCSYNPYKWPKTNG